MRTNSEKVEWLNQQQLDSHQIEGIYIEAAKQGVLELVRYFIEIRQVDPAIMNNYAFRMAASYGHVDVVKFLATLPKVDPSAEDNEAFRVAASHGHVEVVKFLATLPKVDPKAKSNYAIGIAAYNGHLEMVKFLAVSFYNPYQLGITLEEKESRLEFLNTMLPKEEILKTVLKARNQHWIHLHFKPPHLLPVPKEISELIAKKAIDHDLYTMTKPK